LDLKCRADAIGLALAPWCAAAKVSRQSVSRYIGDLERDVLRNKYDETCDALEAVLLRHERSVFVQLAARLLPEAAAQAALAALPPAPPSTDQVAA